MNAVDADTPKRRLFALIFAARQLTHLERLLLLLMAEKSTAGLDPPVWELTVRDLTWYLGGSQPSITTALGHLRDLGVLVAHEHPKDARRLVWEIVPSSFRELPER